MYERKDQIIKKKFLEYLFPNIALSIVSFLISIMDTFVIALFLGPVYMAAFNVSIPLLQSLSIISVIGSGGSLAVAYVKAERNSKKVNEIFTLTILLVLSISIILSLICYFNINSVLSILTQNHSIQHLIQKYVMITILSSPLVILSSACYSFIDIDGFPKLTTIMAISISSINLISVVLLYIFFNIGIEASAYASIIGYMATIPFIIYYYYSKKRSLSIIPLNKNMFKWEYIKTIFNSSIVFALNSIVSTVKTLGLNNIVIMVYGISGMVVFSVASQIMYFLGLFISGTLDSLIPLLSTFYGEKDINSLKYSLKDGFTYLFIIILAMALLIAIFPGIFVTLFKITNPTEISNCIFGIRIVAITSLFTAIIKLFSSYFQAINRIKYSSLISILRVLFVIPLTYVLMLVCGLSGLWYAILLSEILVIIFILLLNKYLEIRSHGRLKGIFLFEKYNHEISLFDVTVESNSNDAVNLSDSLINFVKDVGLPDKTANILGLTTEETIMNIREVNQKSIPVDVLCKVYSDEILINFRDNGVPFDVTKPNKEDSNIYSFHMNMLKVLPIDMKYIQSLGWNNSTITIKESTENLINIINIEGDSTSDSFVNVSQHLIEFARSNGISEKTSTSIGLVIEEISTNINDINHDPVNINFTCKLYQSEVIINIKYTGIIENVSNNDNDMQNMSLIKQVVKDIKYSKINNQNDIRIVINRE